MTILYALESLDDYLAVPSLEAALYARMPGYIVREWCLGPAEHRSEVGEFLECWEPEGMST